MADTTGKSRDDRNELREVVARSIDRRRDPRADPDDDEVPLAAARVDVVDRSSAPPGGSTPIDDSLTNAALMLRRELAKLHQQAAAVERTIEDQRRERSDALEQVDHANARARDLEAKLEKADVEIVNVRRLHEEALDDLQRMRAERDDLARAVENAKGAAEELARVRDEAETLREAHDEALRSASMYEAELAEIRKREQAGAQKLSDGEVELATHRERVERANAELTQLRDETGQQKSELARLRGELVAAGDAAAKQREDLERERAATKEQVERLERASAEAVVFRGRLEELETEAGGLRRETTELRATVARLERDVEAARHTRDVNIERATMAERETDGVRKEVERLQRELEGAAQALVRAEARAAGADRARQSVEESVRQLRDEVTAAFGRWRAPSVLPPAGSAPPPTRVYGDAMTFQAGDEPPVTRRPSPSFPALTAEGRPFSLPTPAPEAPNGVELEDGWPSEPPSPPPREVEVEAKPPPLRPMPKSIPPIPAAPRFTGPPLPETSGSVPPPPPLPARRTTPPPLPTRGLIPPAVYPSVPPPSVTSSLRPRTSEPPPPAAAPASSPEPSPAAGGLPHERDELFDHLAETDTAHAAATALREHPEWLRGRPPVILLEALTSLDYDVEAPVFEVARTWEREPICRAMVALLRDEPDAKLREHLAWLLKHLGSPSAVPAMLDLITSESEAPAVRRWLLEAVERLAATRAIGWADIGDALSQLVRSADASLRDGVIGVLSVLERSEEKKRLLVDLLRIDDDEVVLSSAVQALAGALPVELDTSVTERLLSHPSPRVQRSVADFIERSKKAGRS